MANEPQEQGYFFTANDKAKYDNAAAVRNFSVANQVVPAAVRTYVDGSALTVPAGGFKVGTVLTWEFNITKTAAGIAASTFDVCFGTAGTTADVARLSFTKPAGTAVVDEGTVWITCTIRGPISGSCIAVAQFNLNHNKASTGHATVPCVCVNTVSSAFDITTATKVGVCLTTGAADAITIKQVMAYGVGL